MDSRLIVRHRFTIFYTVLLCLLFIGIPLIFTSFTRSVFEVNKLLWLRLFLIVGTAGWTFESLILNAEKLPLLKNEVNIFFWRIKKTHIGFMLIFWLLSNLISTIFSQNVILSIVGSYDRWEGIITTINYGLLIYLCSQFLRKKWQIKWIVLSSILSVLISSIYGVFQSLNLDFMSWSVDPSLRVFACINNPVHFCAYVAMTIPLLFGFILFSQHQKETHHSYRTGFALSIYAFLSVICILINALVLKDNISPFITGPILGILYVAIPVILHRFLKKNGDRFVTSIFIANIALMLNSIISTFIIYQNNNHILITLSIIFIIISCVLSLNQKTKKVTHHLIPLICLCLSLSVGTNLAEFNPYLFAANIAAVWSIFYMQKGIFPAPREIAAYLILLIVNILLLFGLGLEMNPHATFLLLGNIGLLYPLSALPNYKTAVKRGLIIFSAIIFYAQYISFSRATWIGFVASMPFFYMLANKDLDFTSERALLKDSFLTLIAVSTIVLMVIFNIHAINSVFLIISAFILISWLVYEVIHHHKRSDIPLHARSIIDNLFSIIALSILLFADYSILTGPLTFLFIALLGFVIIFISKTGNPPTKSLISKLIIIFIFMKLQFIPASLKDLLIYIVFVAGYFFANFNGKITRVIDKWLFTFLIIFGIVMFSPNIRYYTSTLFNVDLNNEVSATAVAQKRLSTYSNDAKNGTARTSMWLSSIPWIKDYWIVGSGLDTIKYIYPDYRRPEYGILEGGHNFTPDRLHNEYLNTLASKGVFNFIIYYILLIGGIYYLGLKHIFKSKNASIRHIQTGLLAGALIYLIQVLFNFGVVATLVLFYAYLGLSRAVGSIEEK